VPWFKLQPVEESFFDSAPLRLSDSFGVDRPAARVWEDLTADNPLAWCRLLREITWTSPRPFGVGTTRTARSRAGTIREHFFRWEEGRRMSFYVLESNTPLFRRFAEDYLVEPTTDDSCRFSWTIAVDPQPAARLGNAVNKRLLGTLFSDTRMHYSAS
jgi:hypothetical protein